MTSTIKVDNIQDQDGNNIINENANTITIGASGDTVTLASGASQSGFGRTGTVDWQTTVKTTAFTAVSGEGYFCNTTSAAFTVTLPASPSAGDIVAVKDYAKTFDTNNLTLGRNSSKIGGQTVDATLSTEGASVTLVYSDSTQGWLVVNDGNQSEAPTALYVTATGGTISTCGNFKTHIFTGPGTFTVSCAGNPTGSTTLEYLVVAGGGGGGHDQGGGGGAGGFRSFSSTPGTNSPLNAPAGLTAAVQGYPITVGAGGAAQGNGNNSVFSTITSTAGGYGGGYPPSADNGNPGGSGGGAGFRDGTSPGAHTGGTGNTPPVAPPQGQPGGPISGPGAGSYGAGGGGAGQAGSEDISTGGNGSFVTTTFIGPLATSYGEPQASPPSDPGRTPGRSFAGGGGGRPISHPNSGGVGGGGNGSGCSSTSPGVVNTGGGGGHGYIAAPSIGTGGSGIVMIRYRFQ